MIAQWARLFTCFDAGMAHITSAAYVGSATGEDLTSRIAQHQSGAFPGYTSLRRPVELVWSEYFDRITDAIAAERQIKGWSRAKKEALIGQNWSALRNLAKRPNARSKFDPSS
jgi:putative endonuclease